MNNRCTPICDFKHLTLVSPKKTIKITKWPDCTFRLDIEAVPSTIDTDDTLTIDFSGDGFEVPITADVKVGDVDNSLTNLVVWDGDEFKLREVSSIITGEVPLTFTDGLTRTLDTVRNDFWTGKGTAQTLYGATTSGGDLTISSTTHATKGTIFIGDSVYDEVNDRLGLNTATPTATLSIGAPDEVETLRMYATNATSATIETLNTASLTVSAKGTLLLSADGSGPQMVIQNPAAGFIQQGWQTGGGTVIGKIGIGVLDALNEIAEFYIMATDPAELGLTSAELTLYDKMRFMNIPNDDTATSLIVIDSDERVRYRTVASLPFESVLTFDSGLTRTLDNVQLGGNPLLQHTVLDGDNLYTLAMLDGRFQLDKGADVVSANDLTLGLDGNVFIVTGTTQLTALTVANWQAGAVAHLLFSGIVTVKHNTAGGAGTAPILLAGSVDLVTDANTVLSLVYNGTQWEETSRKQSTSVGSYVFSNGIAETSSGQVKWGSTSTSENRTWTLNGFSATVTGTITPGPAGVFNVTQSNAGGSGNALVVTAVGTGHAIASSSTSGSSISAFSSGTSNATGQFQNTGGGYAGRFLGNGSIHTILAEKTTASTNTIEPIALIERRTSGTAADGIGLSLDFSVEMDNFTASTSNQIISKWTTAAAATRDSDLLFTGVLNAATVDVLTLSGNGAIKLRGITATEASAITAADAMLVYVTDTDATFTAVGIWCREAGTWIKL